MKLTPVSRQTALWVTLVVIPAAAVAKSPSCPWSPSQLQGIAALWSVLNCAVWWQRCRVYKQLAWAGIKPATYESWVPIYSTALQRNVRLRVHTWAAGQCCDWLWHDRTPSPTQRSLEPAASLVMWHRLSPLLDALQHPNFTSRITGNTVVLICCKGDGHSQWKTPHFWPLTAWKPLSIKVWTGDYISNVTHYAKFGFACSAGA